MPPKIVRPKAKSQMSATSKRSRVFKKPLKLEPLVEEKPEIEEKPPENTPPKRASWLDTLHWEPPPDQELHNELSRKRKEATYKKHFNYCKEELSAILNYAFAMRGITDKKTIIREKVEFMKGKFLPKEEDKDDQEVVSVKEKMIRQRTRSKLFEDKFKADELYIENDEVAMDKLMHVVADQDITNYTIPQQNRKGNNNNQQKELKEQQGQTEEKEKEPIPIEFDANPDVEAMLHTAHEGMLKFTETVADVSKQKLPFIISIVGSQCTGKTTIAQYIQSLFNVIIVKYIPNSESGEKNNMHIVSGTDEKQIPQQIAEFLHQLEEGQGLVIVNYPNTKSQLTLLEKALASKDVPNMSQIHGFVRTDFTQANNAFIQENRLIDTNSGRVFSTSFFMPSFISFEFAKTAKLEPVSVPPPDPNSQKLLNGILVVEKSLKKQSVLCVAPPCQFISDLIEVIHQFLSSLSHMKNKEIELTFPEPRYKSQQEFLFSKFCYDVYQQWTNCCLPKYSVYLGKVYSQVMSVKKVVSGLKSMAHDKFILKINCRDQRNTVIKKILQDHHNNTDETNMFNSIWDQTTKIRKENLQDAQEIISTIGFTTIEAFNIDKFKSVFKGIIERYCVIFWFLNTYKNALNAPDQIPPPIEDIQSPSYQINDFVSISDAMYVDAFGKGIRPPEFCVKKPPPKVPTFKMNSANSDERLSSFQSDGNQISDRPTILQESTSHDSLKNADSLENCENNENSPLGSSKLTKGKIVQSSQVIQSIGNKDFSPSLPISLSMPTSVSDLPRLQEKSVTFETDLIIPPKEEEQPNQRPLSNEEPNRSQINEIESSSNVFQKSSNQSATSTSRREELYNEVVLLDRGFPQTIDWSSDQKQLEELIRKYLTYTRDTNPNKAMRDEANLLLCAFNHIFKEKNEIEEYLTVEKVRLEKEFEDIAQKKYQNEMENFSQKTLNEMKNIPFDGPLFTFDHSSIQGELAHLCGTIGGIPDPQKPKYITYSSIEKLVNACEGLKSHINIEELNKLSFKAGLTIRERVELELIARMETNPYVIDPIVLCSVINVPQVLPKRRAQSSFN